MEVTSSDASIFLISIIFCLIISDWYRKILDKEKKKWYGTLIGIFIILITSYQYIHYNIIVLVLNVSIIRYMDRRYMFKAVFCLTTIEFLFYGIFVTNLQLVTLPSYSFLICVVTILRLFGLASDISSDHSRKLIEKGELDEDFMNPTTLDITHFSLNFIGLITGPYYTYRTYRDYIQYPFAKHVDIKKLVYEKLIDLPLLVIGLTWVMYSNSIWYIGTEEFAQSSYWYRRYYVYPCSLALMFQIIIGLRFGETICALSGMGAYPVFTKPKIGYGPSEKIEEMRALAQNEALLKTTEFNYETIKNVDSIKVFTICTLKETVKHKSSGIQFLLFNSVYKRVPNKILAICLTFFFSGIGHGSHYSHFIAMVFYPLSLKIERNFMELLPQYYKDESMNWVKIVNWFLRLHFIMNIFLAWHVRDIHLVSVYFGSTYYSALWELLIFYAIGSVLISTKKKNNLKRNVNNGTNPPVEHK